MSKKFNIKEFLKTRPLSWSAMSSFEYDPMQWYDNYIKGNKQAPSAEMLFGKKFADSCEARKPLAPVTMLSKMEQGFKVVFNGIPMVGFADTFDHVGKKKIGEYKTSKKIWTQKQVDQHGQITMYALFNYITSKIRPEDCRFFLECVQTEQAGDYSIRFVLPPNSKVPKVYHFDTKRTMKDVLDFGVRINKTVQAMEDFVNEQLKNE